MEKDWQKEIFGVSGTLAAKAHQDAKHAVGVAKELAAIELRQQAAINNLYAEAIEHTIVESDGARGSLYMAQLHRTCAARKLALAETIFPSY